MTMTPLEGLYTFFAAAVVDAMCAPEVLRRYRDAVSKEKKLNARGAAAVLPVLPAQHVEMIEDVEMGRGEVRPQATPANGSGPPSAVAIPPFQKRAF
jgi:hypothetical protein